MQHKTIGAGHQHIIHNWKVTTETEMNALDVTAEDIDKICLVSDTDGYYRLKATATNIWQPLSSGGGGVSDHNSLSSLQGGTTNEYYHLTNTVYGEVTNRQSARDLEITDTTKGVILKSPNGTRYRITVADDGSLTTTAL